MTALKDVFTSTGAKLFYHQEAMKNLQNGKGQPVTCHVMPTNLCNHSCAFCSVAARGTGALPLEHILGFLDQLVPRGLKSVIVSGGGNPILYKCPESNRNFNDLIAEIHERGLQIGLITNGMKMREFSFVPNRPLSFSEESDYKFTIRESWGTVHPHTVDMLTWVRISMSGLDHEENEVYVPDVDPEKTTLGFSYVAHDLWHEPADQHHGKVSTVHDLITLGTDRANLKATRWFRDRIPKLTEQISHYVKTYHPRYVRLLPNCLEVDQIAPRCQMLQNMADEIDPNVVFVQYKPPQAPKACYLGYVHPVLNCDGFVYPCDSCVLNESAGHKFDNPWRICHWSEIGRIYDELVRSLIADPAKQCPGCVFTRSNEILGGVVDGTADITPPEHEPEHANFV